jgi:AcrR family transcriptional regulator
MTTGRAPGRGRRPGAPDTRADILASARALFAARGFAGTTIRAVAADAGVDPALVHHYFGSKADLFVASLALPVDPRAALAPVADGDADGAGERLLRTMLSVWDDPDHRLALVATVRGLLDPSGPRLFADGFLAVVIGPVGRALGIDHPDRRMALVASQVVGVLLLRYVLQVEPLASMPAEAVVATYAPTLQRYLTGPLP